MLSKVNCEIFFKQTAVVVVTYNIGLKFKDYINSYSSSFYKIILIDNDSSDATLSLLDDIENTSSNILIIRLKNNIGLASAQNLGISYALEDDEITYIFLLDHDSAPAEGSLSKLAEALEQACKDESFGILGMLPIEEENVEWMRKKVKVAESISPTITLGGRNLTEVWTVMASGSLINRKHFERYGFFDDDFFIDDVDHDFSLRLHCDGLKNFVANDAILIHNLGEQVQVNFLGRKLNFTRHQPFRLYFITRNAIWMWRRYFTRLPKYTIRDFFITSRNILRTLLIDRDFRLENIKYIALGTRDGIFKIKK